ncbi:MAG: MAE_28990/MAE_18760 family HEPN-like nuclease [Methyloversatilis sp.]|uniref:MAE_28990/MAE_18760 family HEPN-like nuclease n=1 Tax=Methyloversatilis sp. TaxID=2569862 RepID=UPI0025E7748B|nr:MAE_28990/MAE_18760 family HEPN-like nuclease [Methyloversatilis sp.]MCR6666548.1 MAE_28990/MAE_18760 family HEPN-like nuclease [Methyloversatilis sp.]
MRFTAELTLAARELARIRADITHADAAVISPSSPVQERGAVVRGSSYVWLAALLERIVRDALQATLREISLLSVPFKDLRFSLFSLLCDAEFASIADRSRSGSWEQKIAIFLRTAQADPALLAENILPLDGRTIRGEHFDTIWLVLGLNTPSLPSPLHRIALRDLADGRNEVAHGHIDPVTFGRSKATKDMLRIASRVDEIIMHLLGSLDSYIDKKQYTR